MKLPKNLAVAHVGPYAVKLTLAERIHVMNLLPEQADVITLRRISVARAALMPSEAEIKAWDVTIANGSFQWQPESDTSAVIEIGESMWDKISEILKEKSKANELNLAQLPLYEKFVEGDKPDLQLAE